MEGYNKGGEVVLVLANRVATSPHPIATEFMLPNEIFALACRSRYEQMGLVVDRHNGEFAHCPLPKKMGDKGYYLLHDDHQHQGLLQSKDVGRCCFLPSYAKRWLMGCKEFPENYFELWSIYEEFTRDNALKAAKTLHAERDENGRSVQGVKNAERLNMGKDEFGRSVLAVKGGRAGGKAVHAERDEYGRSVQAVKNSERLHSEKDEFGKSIAAKKAAAASKLKTQKKTELVRIADGRVFVYDSSWDAARGLGLSQGKLSEVCNGKRKTHKGFTARYLT